MVWSHLDSTPIFCMDLQQHSLALEEWSFGHPIAVTCQDANGFPALGKLRNGLGVSIQYRLARETA